MGQKKMLLWFMSESVLPMFSSKSCIVSGLTFRSLSILSLFLCMELKNDLISFFLNVAVHFSQHAVASLVAEHGFRTWAQSFWRTGLVALWHVGSSQTRESKPRPSFGRWIPIHWTTRQFPV